MQLVQNIMNFLIYFGTMVLVLILVYVGFLFITSQGNPGAIQKARSMAMSAVIGFVVMLGGFLIVSTIMSTFANQDEYGNWSSFFGIERSVCELDFEGGIDTRNPVVTGPQDDCPTCVSLEPLGIDCKSGRCEADEDIANRLQELANTAGLAAWRVTEAIPTTATHRCGCHYNGTCVDINFTGNLQASSPISVSLGQELGTAIAAFIDAAESQGLRAEYEVPINEDKVNIYTAPSGPNPNSIKVISAITAPHFSVYGPRGCQAR
tara:strand:- start:5120 stop:5911 length:792 start_codon:yes stop_codon:yes gene_type:complete